MKSAYRIAGSSAAERARAIEDLAGYRKTQSILYLADMGIPVLDGLIVTRWDSATSTRVDRFCKRRGWDSVLLRHDKSPETPLYPRGGYLIPVRKLTKGIKPYLDTGRIVILLEPAHPFDNGYNVSALFDDLGGITLEVVGPGFDASDLQRGDLSPHEVIRIAARAPTPLAVTRTVLADRSTYRASVRRRYEKMARRLVEWGELSEMGKEQGTPAPVVLTRRYLLQSQHTTLVEHECAYDELPDSCLPEILAQIHELPERLSQYTTEPPPFVVSASYVQNGQKLVFWDIVWPRYKYDLTCAP